MELFNIKKFTFPWRSFKKNYCVYYIFFFFFCCTVTIFYFFFNSELIQTLFSVLFMCWRRWRLLAKETPIYFLIDSNWEENPPDVGRPYVVLVVGVVVVFSLYSNFFFCIYNINTNWLSKSEYEWADDRKETEILMNERIFLCRIAIWMYNTHTHVYTRVCTCVCMYVREQPGRFLTVWNIFSYYADVYKVKNGWGYVVLVQYHLISHTFSPYRLGFCVCISSNVVTQGKIIILFYDLGKPNTIIRHTETSTLSIWRVLVKCSIHTQTQKRCASLKSRKRARRDRPEIQTQVFFQLSCPWHLMNLDNLQQEIIRRVIAPFIPHTKHRKRILFVSSFAANVVTTPEITLIHTKTVHFRSE